jgi:hypothetical protein
MSVLLILAFAFTLNADNFSQCMEKYPFPNPRNQPEVVTWITLQGLSTIHDSIPGAFTFNSIDSFSVKDSNLSLYSMRKWALSNNQTRHLFITTTITI